MRNPLLLSLVPTSALVAGAFATDYLSIPQAQKILFPAASGFAEKTIELTSDQKSQIKGLAGVSQRGKSVTAWKAESGGKFLGWFIADEVVGKHEYITYAAALSPQGAVLGVEILSYRETHGDQVRQAGWRANFKGKTLSNAFKLDKDIPNITGATLSCRNVTDGVKRLLAIQKVALIQ